MGRLSKEPAEWWFVAKDAELPDRFLLRVARTFSFERDDYTYTVRVIHENEIAERTELWREDARVAIRACRDEIMARAIAHLT